MSKHKIFISYSSVNTNVAMDICRQIEESGYACWIAPRNEQAGISYGLQITNAIKQSQVVVLVFSEASNKSEHVLNEVGLAFDNDKKIIPLLLDESEMCADMQYYLSRKHHIKAMNNLQQGISELIYAIRGYMPDASSVTESSEIDKQYILGTTLTETLIDSSADFSIAVRRFKEIIKGIPNWTQQDRILSKAKEIISYSFIGVIGKAFGKLIAISKETSGDKADKFCQESKRIVLISLNLSEFALISKLWDYVNSQIISIGQNDREEIRRRLTSPYQLSIMEHLEILDALINIYVASNGIELPVPELKVIQPLLENGGDVYKACARLSNIANSNNTMEDCKVAEEALSVVLQAFNFYMRYNIVSMKWSRYEKTRTDPTKFLHRYVALGLDNKANMDMEKVNFTDSAITTDSVVMFKNGISDPDSINLYPLVIDLNTLYREHGSKICFFNLNPMINSSLEYLSLDDHSTVKLDTKRIRQKVDDLSDLFTSNENIATYNIDNVINAFSQLQQILLGEDFIDFGDL